MTIPNMRIKEKHISTGGNRHPNAADWSGDILAFGSGNNVAIWRPSQRRGVHAILRGHTDAVNAVRIVPSDANRRTTIVTGSSDKTVRLWSSNGETFSPAGQFDHQASVNTIATHDSARLIVTGTADAALNVWRSVNTDPKTPTDQEYALTRSISLKPRFIPLATALTTLDDGTLMLAVAGTTSIIQIFVEHSGQLVLAASLPGHEGWVRSLDFVRETTAAGSDILLASASQDKYIRLWRIHAGKDLPVASSASQDPSLGVLSRSLSNKPHYIGDGPSLHSVTFEALLIGHEDWIYTAQWKSSDTGASPKLLTTSADNSVSIWHRESDSGYWICHSRLGEISAQKGSTTATGSTGGFWVGLWSPDGSQIASLTRTGSWKIWQWEGQTTSWQQRVGITGHTREVKSIAWARNGSYLLSTSSDQTTRLLGPWKSGEDETWHELARPQIHGYDLNTIDTLGNRQFVSGADEKLLRVFNKPRSTAVLLDRLAQTTTTEEDLPEIAGIPVLGLSNKAIENEDEESDANGTSTPSAAPQAELDIDHAPHEDVLGRHSLWPEHEKLYGHGYEISTVTASHSGHLIATSCRASSIDHAVIRLYETTNWREVKPPLAAHSLTITSLAFSPDDTMLLSVGRDRMWTVFERRRDAWEVKQKEPKGHSRMILDCHWAHVHDGAAIFATAGRDKCIKIWGRAENRDEQFTCVLVVPTASAATAVAFAPIAPEGQLLVACGTEEGELTIVEIDRSAWKVLGSTSLEVELRPAGAINALRWRLGQKVGLVLAAASEDHSVRLYDVKAGSA